MSVSFTSSSEADEIHASDKDEDKLLSFRAAVKSLNSDDDEVIDRILPESCLLEDEGNVVAWSAFLYGLAMTAPFNFITLTLPFFASKMPNYPIEYIVTFAVNGIMVLVVLVCLANP